MTWRGFDTIRLHDPLWLLLPPLLLLTAWLWHRRRHRPAVLYSSSLLLEELPRTWRQRCRSLLPVLRWLGVLLVALALARPQGGLREFRIRTEGIAIQMCLDRSGSMLALDFSLHGQRVDRLNAVKDVFRRFVGGDGSLPGRSDDLIGLVVFGGYAESKSPLTLDHGALLQVLDTIEVPKPALDAQGRVLNDDLLAIELKTAIGDALAVAVDRLRQATAKSKIIILLSDGESNEGVLSPEEAAELARSLGIRVYTIGVGRTGYAPFPVRDRYGNVGVDAFGRKAYHAQYVTLDEQTLRMVAERTGGRYFAADSTEALEDVYAEIDKLERTATAGRLYTEYEELFGYLLWPGLILVVIERMLAGTWLRTLP